MLRIVVFFVVVVETFLMSSRIGHASPVTVDGGFTDFVGTVGFGNVRGVAANTETIVNGVSVQPGAPLPANSSPLNAQDFPAVGYGSLTFPRTTPTVQFSVLPLFPPSIGNVITFAPAPPAECHFDPRKVPSGNPHLHERRLVGQYQSIPNAGILRVRRFPFRLGDSL
jgi:hypothetical protein